MLVRSKVEAEGDQQMHGMVVDVFMLSVERRDDGLVVVAEGEDLLSGDAEDGCLGLVSP